MGYYTDYSLSCIGDDEEIRAFCDDLVNEHPDEPELQQLVDGEVMNMKWYHLSDWIGKTAARHPDVLVILDGDGENSNDLWQERWKGDEHECHSMMMPPFTSPDLLTDDEKQGQR